MARATLNTIRRIVYENLGVTTNGAYGTLLTNERYPTAYIDDKIAEADIYNISLLLKNKQHTLLKDLWQTQNGVTDGQAITPNWIIVGIDITIASQSGYKERENPNNTKNAGIEVDFGTYVGLRAGGIFDTASYLGYYTIHNDTLYFIGDTASITYIDLTHATSLTTLFSPTAFEGAVANLASSLLLMKRGDKPEQSKYYLGLYEEFMKQFLSQESSIQVQVDD